MNKTYTLQQTKLLAEEIAKRIKKKNFPNVVGLTGDLGSGKTTFVSFLAASLGIEKRILSPTFVITREYPFDDQLGRSMKLYHIDLYRLDKESASEIGLQELLGDEQAVLVIEWAEKVRDLLPPNTFWMNFEFIDQDRRKITTL